MANLLQYTGKEPPEWIHTFFQEIEALGFSVTTSNRGRAANNSTKKTLLIEWRGLYVAYTHYDLWRHGRFYGLRFNVGEKKATNACPPEFDLQEFCLESGWNAASFSLYSEKSGSYLQVHDKATAIHWLLKTIDRLGRSVSGSTDLDADLEVQKDLDNIHARKDINETTRKALIDARLGQGRFRSDLLKIFDGGCAVSGLMLTPLLRASHIVPWKNATDTERLDPDNGLLLTANIDALFDRYLIAFKKDGCIQISRLLNASDSAKLSLIGGALKTSTPRRATYLERHYALFELREQQRKALEIV